MYNIIGMYLILMFTRTYTFYAMCVRTVYIAHIHQNNIILIFDRTKTRMHDIGRYTNIINITHSDYKQI